MSHRADIPKRVATSLAILIGAFGWAQQSPDLGPAAALNPTLTVPASLQPPTPKSPVDQFRNLLGMTSVERREFIAKRPPEVQKAILAKIHEYEGLQPDERELRLRVTELRWYLLPLLRMPVTNRVERLNAIPGNVLRDLVDARLREWDKLEPNVQKELLDNESTVRFYFELATRGTTAVTNVARTVGTDLESGIQRWQSLTEEERHDIALHFCQFFDLRPAEKTKILTTLSEPERLQIEKTLHTFESLTPVQRTQCLRSFQKFASLSPDERRQFLKNAERWERMTPSERQTWRNLVSNLANQPPLPGNLAVPPAPSVPTGPLLPRAAKSPGSLLTNTN
jgi:hypothetical protein